MPISVSEIMEILPHRYPFLLIDGVISEPAELACGKLIAIKNVTTNDTVVFGEFYPPLLLLESLAQAAGILAHYYLSPMEEGQQCYFASIKNARFYDAVKAGDQLHLDIQYGNPQNPMTDKDVISKFYDNASLVMQDKQLTQLVEKTLDFENVTLSEITQLLRIEENTN